MSIIRNSDGTYTIGATELYSLLSQISLAQLQVDAGLVPPPPSPPVNPPTTTVFQGIYAFSGNISACMSTPGVSGAVLTFAWSDIEPAQGIRDWTVIDKVMVPWLASGKKVALRVSASGWKNWSVPANASYTPSWIYKLGVKSVTSQDGAIKPAYWDTNFLKALQSFIAAFGARYDNNPGVAFIEVAVGDGGETKPDTRKTDPVSAWTAIGYSDAVWLATIRNIVDIYKSAFPTKPLVLMPDNSFLIGGPGFNMDAVMQYAASQGVGLQDNGLTKGTMLKSSAWGKAPFIVGEQGDKLSQQQGVTLEDIITTGLGYKARFLVLFSEDILANLSIVAKYGAK